MLKSIYNQLLIALMVMGILNVLVMSSLSLQQGQAFIDQSNHQRKDYIQDHLKSSLEAPLKNTEILIEHLEDLLINIFPENQPLPIDPVEFREILTKISPEVRRIAQNSSSVHSAFIYFNPELINDNSPQGVDIYFTDQNGDQVTERQAQLPKSYFDAADEGNKTKEWWFGPLKTKEHYWTNPYEWTYDNGQSKSIVSISKAIYRGDQLLAVVGTDITFDYLTQVLDFSEAKTKGYAYLLNKNGEGIFLPHDFTEPSLQRAIKSANEYEQLSIVLSNGWTLGLLTPIHIVKSSYDELLRSLLTSAIIVILQAVTLAAVVSHYLTLPLKEITSRINQNTSLHEGLTLPPSIVNRKDEIGAVAKSLLSMSESIQSHLNTIESQRQTLQYIHQRDELTHLPNKEYLHYHYKQIELQLAKRKHLVMILNIDNFRMLNGMLGASLCDRILIEISKRLSGIEPKSLLITRTSGDEFTLIHTLEDDESGLDFVVRLQSIVNGVYILVNEDIHLSISMGASVYPDHGTQLDILIKNAAIALNQVKTHNKSHFAFYDPKISEVTSEQFEILKKLRDAIATGQMQLYYQPQVNALTGKCVGAEALLRWQVDGSFIPPLTFIPLAESSKLIIPLGDLVIQKSFEFARKLNAMNMPIKLSINISSEQLTWDHLYSVLIDASHLYQVKSELIALEITESLIVNGHKTAIEVLKSLVELGFDIAIDDFGTGYSSLSYLKSIPFSTLKLDRMFIKDYPEKDDGTIAKMIISLAKELGATVISEGMENAEQSAFIQACGCHIMQGYYYSKPLSEDEFVTFLQKNHMD